MRQNLLHRLRRASAIGLAGIALSAIPAVVSQAQTDAHDDPVAGEPHGSSQESSGLEELPDLAASLQNRIVKVFGAGAGQVEAYSTGVVVSADGWIVTSQGVYLDGARTVAVLSDGRVFEASIVRRDRSLQLAVLKIDTATPDFFVLEGRSPPAQGDWVLTLSNAFRVADKQEPVSAWLGIVSLPTSIHAMLNERDVAYSGKMILVDSITSNPGAAGGAVVSLDGQLVGVIGKIIESSETNTRLNYAVPLSVVRDFVNGNHDAGTAPPGIAVPGSAEPGETGIVLFELGGKSGPAYIDRVTADSPAARAGILADDLVISVGGEKASSVRACQTLLSGLAAESETIIVVKRGNQLLRYPVVPAKKDRSEGGK